MIPRPFVLEVVFRLIAIASMRLAIDCEPIVSVTITPAEVRRLLKVVGAVGCTGCAGGRLRALCPEQSQRFHRAETLARWTLVVDPDADALGSSLVLSPPASLASPLGREIFPPGGESVNYPSPPLCRSCCKPNSIARSPGS